MTTQTEKVTGKIQELWTGEAKTKFGIKDKYYIRLNDVEYSKFGTIPKDVQEARDNRRDILIEFEANGFNNIKNIIALPDSPKSINKPPANATLNPPKDNGFGKGSDIPEVDLILHGVDYVMRRCRDKVTAMIGHEPKIDGECAMTNSMFIETNKKLNNPMFMKILRECPR